MNWPHRFIVLRNGCRLLICPPRLGGYALRAAWRISIRGSVFPIPPAFRLEY